MDTGQKPTPILKVLLSDKTGKGTSRAVQKNKGKTEMPNAANNGDQELAAGSPNSDVINQVQENGNSPHSNIQNLENASDSSNTNRRSVELLNNLKVSNEIIVKTEENAPQAGTSKSVTPNGNAKVSASASGKFKIPGPMPPPTVVQFRSLQIVRQDSQLHRKMRLFPTVRCYTNFEGIFRKINFYNPKDSSALFNFKVDYLIKGFRKDCKSRSDVLVVLRLIFNHCLHNIDFAKNVAPFFCCMKFYPFRLHGVSVTRKFFIKMQYAFLESSIIRCEDRNAFRNLICFTGDCYSRLMLVFSHPYHLENYLIEYMQMLLDAPEEKDMKLFTLEVYRNGKNLCQKYWIKMSHLFLQLRSYQIHNTTVSYKAKVWVMLALDLYAHLYDLPKELVMFYKEFLKHEMNELVKLPDPTGRQYPIPMEICETDPEEPLEI